MKEKHSPRGNLFQYNIHFLLSIGLIPRKSLTLGTLKIPDQYFVDFLRGLIDGDGCIRRWLHPSNKREQWSLRIYSGSEPFAAWVSNTVEKLIGVKGRIHKDNGRNICVLKYGKMAAREIAQKCYYKDCFGLMRKIELAKRCESSYAGWEQSKTVLN